MRRLQPRTLLWRLGLALMVMQAVVAVVFGAWGFSRLKRFHYEQMTRQLQQHAPLVAAAVAPLLADPGTGDAQVLARDLGQRSGVRIRVIDPGGIVVGGPRSPDRQARSRELGGTGLGLAIVKHIALVHGGRAEARSAAGTGSVFRIVLPAGAALETKPERIPG